MCEAIISGVISGIISSTIIYIVLFGIKPKVIISDKMCCNPKDNKFRVKIVNCSRFNLIDVKYTLHYCRRYSDGIGELAEIEPSKSRLEFINAFSSADHFADYAVRITYDIDERFEFADNDCILFTFYAKHALSGTSIFMRKKYEVGDIKCGKFETGKSTKILVESCNKTFRECRLGLKDSSRLKEHCAVS